MVTAKPKLAPVVSILNMKGGVGKTTISAHVFRVLYHKLSKRVLLIDLDPQFNLTQTVLTRTGYEKLKNSGKTIMSVIESNTAKSLFDVSAATAPIPDPSKLCQMLRHFPKSPRVSLNLIAGDFDLVKYSLMSDVNQLSAARQRFFYFVEMARADFDLVCIDCNPSSSFLTLCALRACTHVLVPVRPDKYSVLGLEILNDFVQSVPEINPKPKFIILLNGIPTQNYDESVENELRAHPAFGARTLAKKLYQSSLLRASSDYTGFATDKKVPHKKTLLAKITAIVDEIAAPLGL